MLLLEHRGRRSGLPRHAVLEVIAHPDPDAYVVASGFGETSQWYRNVTADPDVRVSVGWQRRRPAIATRLSDADADAALSEYARRHPRTWQRLRATLETALHTTDLRLPMFALRLER